MSTLILSPIRLTLMSDTRPCKNYTLVAILQLLRDRLTRGAIDHYTKTHVCQPFQLKYNHILHNCQGIFPNKINILRHFFQGRQIRKKTGANSRVNRGIKDAINLPPVAVYTFLFNIFCLNVQKLTFFGKP